MTNELYNIRLAKLEDWALHRPPRYPDRFEKSHTCAETKNLDDGTDSVSLAGRLIALRQMGKLTFGHVQDDSGQIQISLNTKTLGNEEYQFLLQHVDIGDYVGIVGKMFTTRKGEKTLDVESLRLLAKALRTLPEKWHGLIDPEVRARQRYLDLIANEETRQRFQKRNRVLRFIRSYLEASDFFEVETPILQIASSGASARPFVTHHNALDIPLYLRIAPETYLKRIVVGGNERVFEMGKCFRNEGVDAAHLQEFTMMEYYAAYWNYRDNMRFIKSLLQALIKEVNGSEIVEYQGRHIDFSGEWKEITYRDLVLRETNIDLDTISDLDQLKQEVRSKGFELPLEEYVGLGALMDALYKKYCRPKLIQPMFLTKHPSELVPLARRSDSDPRKLDMFQVVCNSWEIVKAYSELVDPIEQRVRLLEQRALAEAGDQEAMMLEEDFILCMEYWMPPMSGLGLGVDRVITLLTNSKNIRDVIYFPSLRPLERSDVES